MGISDCAASAYTCIPIEGTDYTCCWMQRLLFVFVSLDYRNLDRGSD